MVLENTMTARCPECSKCQNCKKSNKETATSIQDSIEQLAIEKSVHIDLVKEEVWVDLPFTQNPDEFLSKKHHGSSNYSQALRIYQSQCRKAPHIREGIRSQQAELVDHGFMKRMSDLPKETQQMIKSAPFRHYLPYRSVEKESSISTPVRIIVDPTVTGLNLCLPKGENKITKIPPTQ